MKQIASNEEYGQWVEQITPKNNYLKNCLFAFLVGGLICTFGEWISTTLQHAYGFSKVIAGNYTSLLLVLISVILTGCNLYKDIAKFAGAGALVPITGFANSVCAPTIEFQKEGEVFGKGVKVFTIAGPVILFGIVTSAIAGLIYWIIQLF